jgi:uncharacterized repeat protein (TIGR03803 family)
VGTVFKIGTNGTGFTTLYHFTAPPYGYYTNSDGAFPEAGLISSGNKLYGTASGGGLNGYGTVFVINTDGTDFQVLYTFNPITTETDAYAPYAELVLSGNALYGTTRGGGSLGYGTVFSLSFAPQLTITRTGATVVLTWPIGFAGFDYRGFTLQSTTGISPTDWSPVAEAAVTNAGQISVTVPATVAQKFFRLNSQ